MFASFLLSLREGLEGALIIGIILAALKKTGRTELARYVWRGVAVSIIFSVAAAFLLGWLGMKFEGRAEEIFEGIAMLLAAGLLTWMIIWMYRQALVYKDSLEEDVRSAAGSKNSGALFWLAFLAVGREGLELVLFLFATSLISGSRDTLAGAWLGLAASVLVGWMVYRSSLQLKLGRFFLVVNTILVLFAAGLVAHGVHEFNEAGVIPSVVEHVWDTNGFINEKQPLGQLLTALFGYNGNPSLTEVIAYFTYFLGLGVLWKTLSSRFASAGKDKGTA